MLTLTTTQAALRLAGFLLSQWLCRYWMINYPLRSRANSFLGCKTPPLLTVEWIYTHSFRAKGDDLWKNEHGGKFSNWRVRCHWVDLIFCISFSSFFFWSFFISDHFGISATREAQSRRAERREEGWGEIGFVLCALSYWPLNSKLLCCTPSSVYTSCFLLFGHHGWSGIYGWINGK